MRTLDHQPATASATGRFPALFRPTGLLFLCLALCGLSARVQGSSVASSLQLQHSSQRGDSQAVWQLFSSCAPTPSSSFRIDGVRNLAYGDDSIIRAITDPAPVQPFGPAQAFLTQVASPVPEPGTNLFIAFAVVSLSCLWTYIRG